MTLHRRLQLLIASVTAVLVVAVAAVGFTLVRFQADAEERDRLAMAVSEVAALVADAASPRPPDVDASLRGVETEVGPGRGQVRVAEARAAFRTLEDTLAAPAPNAAALEAARARAQAATAALADELQRMLDRALDRGVASRARFVGSVIAAAGAALLLLLYGAAALQRWVVAPVARLHDDVDAVAAGVAGSAIRPSGSRDLVELGAAVERMRARILRERDARERAIESADQDAPAVAALRRLLAPATAAVPPRIDVAATLVPAEGALAGDWYDLVASDGGIVVTLGDVCGHGASTGAAAVRTKFALLDAVHLRLEPGDALGLAARRFGDDSDFVTAVVAEFDPALGTYRYANAGHPPPLVVDAHGAACELPATGPLIGPFPATWETRAMTMKPGDTFILYSDGLTEARDAQGSELGVERLRTAVATTAGQAAQVVLDQIVAELFRHAPDGIADDVTIAVLRYS